MTTCRSSIIRLFDELLTLFEDENKLIYKRLLILRHKIRIINESDVYDECRSFYLKNSHFFLDKDVSVFKNTPFYSDVETIWSELSPANKSLVWKWIGSILNQLI